MPKVVAQQRRGRASNPRLLDRKSDALPLSHRATPARTHDLAVFAECLDCGWLAEISADLRGNRGVFATMRYTNPHFTLLHKVITASNERLSTDVYNYTRFSHVRRLLAPRVTSSGRFPRSPRRDVDRCRSILPVDGSLDTNGIIIGVASWDADNRQGTSRRR